MIDDLTYLKGSEAIGPAIALLEAAERDWSLVLFQPEQPVLEGELNLLQQSQNRRMRDLVRGIYPAGGILKDLNPSATGAANEIRLHTEGTPFNAILDGIVKTVYAYDTPASGSPVVSGNRVTLPAYTSGTYDEIVYLEVWFEEVMASGGGTGTDSNGDPASADTTVHHYGMNHGFTLENDVRIDAVPVQETTRRVQLRGEIKVARGSDPAGELARGQSGYGYGLVSGTNYYRAGAGTAVDGDALNTVDGYAYALPLVRINRQSSVVQDAHIEVATDLIPTGSDVSDRIIALETSTGDHYNDEQGVHGLPSNHYVARTPRSDNRVEFDDIANVPSYSLASHLHDGRYLRYDADAALSATEQTQARSNIDAARADHTHPWSEVTAKPDEATRWPAWSEVTSKPSTFTPSPHAHPWGEVTGKPAQSTRWPSWSEVTGKPSVVETSRQVATGTGLTGGGNLGSNRTISIAAGGVNTPQLADDAVTPAKLDRAYSLAGHDHDGRYYTQGQLDSFLSGKSNSGHNHDSRYYTEDEIDQKFAAIDGDLGNLDGTFYTKSQSDARYLRGDTSDTLDGNLTLTGRLTVGKNSGASRIAFPSSSGGSDPGYIEHDESTSNSARMRFVVGDDDTDSDYFSFGSSDNLERARITAAGKGYFSSLFVGGSSVVTSGRTINAGSGLTGGGSLGSDRTLSVDGSVVRTSRTISAGTGLSGGGSLGSDRTFSIANGGVDTPQLADGAATRAKIGSNAVGTGELGESSVTPSKLDRSYLEASNGVINRSIDVNGTIDADGLNLNLGEGLLFTDDDAYWTSSADARIIRLLDHNATGGNVDGGLVIDAHTPSDGATKELLAIRANGTFTWMGSKIWHEGNDGPGTGLNADLLDGKHASAFSLDGHGHDWGDLSGYPSLSAGAGLSGGGSLSGSRTIGIANGGVNTAQLADDAVTGAKLAAGSVGPDHLDRFYLETSGGTVTGNVYFRDDLEGVFFTTGGAAKGFVNYDISESQLRLGAPDAIHLFRSRLDQYGGDVSRVELDVLNGVYNFKGTLQEDGNDVWHDGNTAGKIAGTHLANGAVDSRVLAGNSVGSSELKANSVGRSETDGDFVSSNASSIYFGRVGRFGDVLSLPSGWSCSRLSVGKYRVNHNLSHSDYGVTATISGPYEMTANANPSIYVYTTSDYFVVESKYYNSSVNDVDHNNMDFAFTLFEY